MAGRKSLLDRPLAITVFRSVQDNRNPSRAPLLKAGVSLRELQQWVSDTSALTKEALPLLKLGVFGQKSNENGFYRHDGNLREISGVECDYDGEKTSIDQAAALLEEAGVSCLLYTTPSHVNARPRWRVLAPCSEGRDPEQRALYVSRINGVLGGILKAESFVRSQIFYYGGVEGAATPQTRLIVGDFIDKLKRLDATALGKDEKRSVRLSEPDDTRSGRHFRKAIESVRLGRTFEEHLKQLDGEVAEYAVEKRGRSTKGEHDWQRAIQHVEKQRSELLEDFDDHNEGETAQGTREFSGFMTVDEMEQQKRPFDFVEGLLYEEQLSVWYGLPKAGKSFLTLDLCCHVGNGKMWAGKKVEQRNVLVLPLEGRGTLIDRVRAWEAYNNARCPVVFRMKPFDVSNNDDVAEVMAYVRDQQIGLVVFDTLARSMPGTDEDRAKDMGLVIQRFDQIKDAGAHVLLVHHSNKGGTMRGSIAVAGAADLVVNISRHGQQRSAKIEANRHGRDGNACRFTLKQQQLDTRDARGNAVVSAAVVHDEDWFDDDDVATSIGEDAGKSDEKVALKILRKHARNDDLIGPMTRRDASKVLREEGWGPSRDGAFRTAVCRLMQSLEEKGLVSIEADGTIVWDS